MATLSNEDDTVKVGSLVRVAAAVAAAFALVPSLLVAFAGSSAVHQVRLLFDGWSGRTCPVSLLGSLGLGSLGLASPGSIDAIRQLHLQAAYDAISGWDEHLTMVFVLLWIVPLALTILGATLFTALVGVLYNRFGCHGQVEAFPVVSHAPKASAQARDEALDPTQRLPCLPTDWRPNDWQPTANGARGRS